MNLHNNQHIYVLCYQRIMGISNKYYITVYLDRHNIHLDRHLHIIFKYSSYYEIHKYQHEQGIEQHILLMMNQRILMSKLNYISDLLNY